MTTTTTDTTTDWRTDNDRDTTSAASPTNSPPTRRLVTRTSGGADFPRPRRMSPDCGLGRCPRGHGSSGELPGGLRQVACVSSPMPARLLQEDRRRARRPRPPTR